jgi:uncharacterized protein (UPF0332 family)
MAAPGALPEPATAAQHRPRRAAALSTRTQVAELLRKADRACQSAALLLAEGDLDGACNRAYYAMFDAARAVMMAADPGFDPANTKTHGGFIASFGQAMVRTGRVSVEMGRLLNRAHEVRLIADYRGEAVTREDAAELVAQAARFVDEMRRAIAP